MLYKVWTLSHSHLFVVFSKPCHHGIWILCPSLCGSAFELFNVKQSLELHKRSRNFLHPPTAYCHVPSPLSRRQAFIPLLWKLKSNQSSVSNIVAVCGYSVLRKRGKKDRSILACFCRDRPPSKLLWEYSSDNGCALSCPSHLYISVNECLSWLQTKRPEPSALCLEHQDKSLIRGKT